MTRFYSPSTGCTYLDSIHHDIPADARPITDERYDQVIGNPAPGKVRAHDVDGLPILVDRQGVPVSEQAQAIHTRQVAAINLACTLAITDGFESAALGESHRYSSDLEDQLNLNGMLLQGGEMLYPCYDAQGVKVFLAHTGDQLRQVAEDFAQYKLQLMQRANELKQQLDAALIALDLVALEGITFEDRQP